MDRAPEAEAFWPAFCAASGVDPASRCDVFSFGDSPAMADELAELVVSGPKRATAGLLRDFGPGGEPLPAAGAHSIVLDGRGSPVAVIRTIQVEVKPLIEVDEDFAWDEGEGDRTRDDWLDGHRRFFRRRAEIEDYEFSDDLPAVFERFALVWTGEGPPG